MGFFSDKCPECNAKVRRGASFCPSCGEAAPKAKMVCPSCGVTAKATAKFCGRCGAAVKPQTEEESPVDTLNRWKRTPDEFARRIEASDLRGLLNRGLVVEPGTRALIFQGGALAGAVSEGTYDLNRPMEGVDAAMPATAILADAGDVVLPLLYENLRTQEEVTVDGTVEVVVRLSDPAAVNANLMHGRDRLSVSELAEMLWNESANVLQARVRGTSVTELDASVELKSSLEDDLREKVGDLVARNGLELVRLRFVGLTSGDYEKVQDKRAKTFLAGEKLEDTERRAIINQRLRETLTRDRMDKFNSERDFEEFVKQTEHEEGMKGVIRKEEMEDLKRTFVEKKGDAETARKHLLELLELGHQLEVLRKEHSIDDETLQKRLQHARQELEARHKTEWDEAQHKHRIADLERDKKLADEKAKIRIRDDKGILGLKLRVEKIDLAHKEASQQMSVEQEAKDREAQRELERHRVLSQVEQERLAVDLKKTELMKDMTEDQILALMAKDSPDVANAIAERSKAQAQAGSSQEVRTLYDKMLAAKEAEADRLERVMDKAMQSIGRAAESAVDQQRQQKEEIKDIAGQSMDRMADVAAARAANSAAAAEPSGATEVVCPKCQSQSPAGTKFCDNCGYKFFE